LKHFDDLGLADPLLRAVTGEGYSTPTLIQAQVIPAMLAGRDVLGTAQTGTGKTASFVLPLLQRIIEHRAAPEPKRCGALIMTPTRELAMQIAENIRTYGQHMNVTVAVVVGGVKPKSQIKALAKGIDIVVATPGRLLDHMNSDVIHLDQTASIVLDEADQMLDLGFVPAIRKIIARLPKERQTVLMSATMPNQIRKLAADFQTRPQEISVAAVSRPIERITQSVLHVPAADKRMALTDLLAGASDVRAIVFTRTKRGADKVSRHLATAGMSAAAIHGNKSQPQRERTLASFRTGRTSILVATDIAARGIDIDDVTHVINYELPHVAESYVHRIGRTARAGRSGIAVSLCCPEERSLLLDIERLIGNRLDVQGEPEPHGSRGLSLTQETSGEKTALRNRSSRPKSTTAHRGVQPETAISGLTRMLGQTGSTTPSHAI
jgi:ATP-dependent RNA helicase RhlE